ncbi:MAG: FAD:protein FMN transferase [Spirochaetales bacterium]|nr:MAG: FAD:protein FMN transferase [Spirochaetales bacterium]
MAMRRFPVVMTTSILLFSVLVSCARNDYSQSKSEFLLGTVCTIKLFEKTKADVFTDVFARVLEIEQRMSTVIETSEVSQINAGAGISPAAVSPDTLFVIQRALYYGDLSGGAFDISIGPLVTLWGIGTDHARLPEKEEIEALLPLVNYRDIAVDPEAGTVYLKRKGMSIDLGGIAKGYAADEAARLLKERGLTRAIIDFGGNIYVLGSKGKNLPWRVGVQNPQEERGTYVAIIQASDKALVSSGTYERFFIREGRRYHHILDTKTGYPVENGLSDTTVITDISIDADALSTVLFTLGLDKAYALAAGLSGVDAVFVTTGREIIATPGLEGMITAADDTFKIVPYRSP